MKWKMYSIYDTQVEAYLRPIFARSDGEALRMFIDQVNSGREDTPLSAHPEHFMLFYVGWYDDHKATFGDFEAKKCLCSGNEVFNPGKVKVESFLSHVEENIGVSGNGSK